MSLLSLVFGAVFVLAGVYQFVDGYVPAVRVLGLDPSDADAAPEDRPVERVFSTVVGVALVLVGAFFLWLGQY